MKISLREEGEKIIDMKPEEEQIIKMANGEFIRLIANGKQHIVESTLSNILQGGLIYPNPQILASLAKQLEIIMGQHSVALLLNTILSSENANIMLNELVRLELINEDTYQFLLDLSIKYGVIYNIILSNIEKPSNWSRIESNLHIINEDINLNTKIWRVDGKLLEFNMPLRDGVTLAEHFLRRTLDIIKDPGAPKKRLLGEISDKKISNLEKMVTEIKELYRSSRDTGTEIADQ